LQGIYQARRRANPVSMAELVDIVDIWSDAAMALSDLDIRKMLRLAGAQEKRLARQHGGAVAAEAAE
jgi:DSF synthase